MQRGLVLELLGVLLGRLVEAAGCRQRALECGECRMRSMENHSGVFLPGPDRLSRQRDPGGRCGGQILQEGPDRPPSRHANNTDWKSRTATPLCRYGLERRDQPDSYSSTCHTDRTDGGCICLGSVKTSENPHQDVDVVDDVIGRVVDVYLGKWREVRK
ncbi:hypothetical protein BT67DRAFT_407443 [Trichocladium antarcticum]|uniref:Secreted protein n=1 Tax=Trichocladium antarcticum TaxID=1450529 RepID=A0AAN6UFV0_9PEZI|nr:hypothetical protein BT67DRAFT_407443 [Trichocladium antarcticum]